jgi:hypothetical protein
MSGKLFPVPVETPVSDDPKFGGLKFGAIWMRFLKAISDDLLAANIANNLPTTSITSPVVPDVSAPVLAATARAIKYVLNANLCVVTYYVPAALTVPIVFNLPFTALLAFDIDGAAYPEATKSVTIPANIAYLRFWYIASPGKGA